MSWTITDKQAEFHTPLDYSAKRIYGEWRGTIESGGVDAQSAAEFVGSDVEAHGGGKFTIRLSGGHRVYFAIDENSETVVVKKVGSTKAPRWWW